MKQYTDIKDLNDIQLEYTVVLKDGSVSTFTHTFQSMLINAKNGVLPYLSFAEYRVIRPPRVIINVH